MKKVMVLSILTVFTICSACSSGGTSAKVSEQEVKEEVKEEAKEEEKHELVEVQITKDNWEDYFEVYEEPYMVTAANEKELPADTDFTYSIDNAFVDEEHQNSEYQAGFQLMIKLKDEFIDQLDFNKDNSLHISYTTEIRIHKYEGDQTTKKIGEEISIEEILSDYDDEQARESSRLTMEDQGLIDENGFYCYRTGYDKTITDKDLTKGTLLGIEGFGFKKVETEIPDSDGVTHYYQVMQISEGPYNIGNIDSIDWKEVSGTIYLNQ